MHVKCQFNAITNPTSITLVVSSRVSLRLDIDFEFYLNQVLNLEDFNLSSIISMARMQSAQGENGRLRENV